jgi:hypothetical protein
VERTLCFNVKSKSGGLLNRLTAREIYGLTPREIEWIYLVEQKRNATPEEIRELCKRPAAHNRDARPAYPTRQ